MDLGSVYIGQNIFFLFFFDSTEVNKTREHSS